LFPLLSSGGGGDNTVSAEESRRFLLCLFIMLLPSGELSFLGWQVLRRLRISLPMGSSGSSMVASCGGWRASLRGIPVQESSAGGASIRMEGVSSGLLVGGYRGSFGSCGSQESGSGFEIPWRLLSSTVGLDPGSPELGVRLRPTVFQRLLHLVLEYECLLRLSQKPCGDGASSDLRVVASAVRRWPAATRSGGIELHRDQGLT